MEEVRTTAPVWGLDHQALADVHADVVDAAGAARVAGEEDQVPGDQVERVDRAHAGVGGELGARHPGDGDPGGGVGEAGQAGAVEGARAVGAPDVGRAELGQGDGDGLAGGRRGAAVAGRGGAGRARVGQVVGEGGPVVGLLAAAFLLDEAGDAAVHGAELVADLGGQALGLGALGVELGRALGLGDQAGREARTGVVELGLGPRHLVDQGQVAL